MKRKVKGVFRGDRLREIRKARGLTEAELAYRIGGKQQQIADYETKNRYPRTDTLVKLVGVLDCSADYLLGLSEKPSEQIPGLSSKLALLLSTLPKKELQRIERLIEIVLEKDGG